MYFIKQEEIGVTIDIWKYVHLFLKVALQVTQQSLAKFIQI